MFFFLSLAIAGHKRYNIKLKIFGYGGLGLMALIASIAWGNYLYQGAQDGKKHDKDAKTFLDKMAPLYAPPLYTLEESKGVQKKDKGKYRLYKVLYTSDSYEFSNVGGSLQQLQGFPDTISNRLRFSPEHNICNFSAMYRKDYRDETSGCTAISEDKSGNTIYLSSSSKKPYAWGAHYGVIKPGTLVIFSLSTRKDNFAIDILSSLELYQKSDIEKTFYIEPHLVP